MRGCPVESVPARTSGSGPIVAEVGRFALSVVPSASVTRTEGIVTVASVPVMPTTPWTTLSTTIMPRAPAFWTFFALSTKAQLPRSTSAIFPASAAGLLIVLQASVSRGPAVSRASVATTTGAVTETDAAGAPKSAVPTAYVPADAAGAATERTALRPL